MPRRAPEYSRESYTYEIRRTSVICPKCGEDNSDTFRFCGMCGNLLEARRPVNALMSNQSSSLPRAANAPASRMAIEERAIWPGDNARQPVPPISGPSMLGLNQPVASPLSPSHAESQPKPDPSLPRPSQPSADLLREKSFSGLDSFFEPEQPKTGARRIALLVVLLAALGVAGWWAYGYLESTENRKSAPATPATAQSDGDVVANSRNDSKAASHSNSTPTATADAPAEAKSAPAPEVSASTPPPSVALPEGPSQNAHPIADVPPTQAPRKPATNVSPASPKADRRAQIEEKRQASIAAAMAARASKAAPVAHGEADFRKGEAYLYGRGVPENCDQAVKSLKAASAQQSAKARSAFGTMYATGHCVPRDLPTSYLWFAQALQLDPNNQILGKDLNAIWNQMTPPERQMATRMKQ
jgi:cytoskeletal protein RodZ